MINESRNYSDVVQAGQKYGEEVGKVVGKFAGGLLALNLCATDCTFHVTKAALKAIYDTENAIANKATSYFPAEKHIKLALSTALVTGGLPHLACTMRTLWAVMLFLSP
ncbi:MAG: hypothetical protein S4CHLAM123_00060 [Chlamydiales bacterium]|nr:hypothetical protein [Chlamydiales bacterium]